MIMHVIAILGCVAVANVWQIGLEPIFKLQDVFSIDCFLFWF